MGTTMVRHRFFPDSPFQDFDVDTILIDDGVAWVKWLAGLALISSLMESVADEVRVGYTSVLYVHFFWVDLDLPNRHPPAWSQRILSSSSG
jgi:hypothetical protein